MSNENAIKSDPICAHFLWGHDDFRESFGENGSLDGNEVRKIVGGDTGESQVFDPVESFCRKVSENRFGTTPEGGGPLKKRWADNDPFALAIQKAARMRKEGRVMKLFDAVGNLLAEKEVAE